MMVILDLPFPSSPLFRTYKPPSLPAPAHLCSSLFPSHLSTSLPRDQLACPLPPTWHLPEVTSSLQVNMTGHHLTGHHLASPHIPTICLLPRPITCSTVPSAACQRNRLILPSSLGYFRGSDATVLVRNERDDSSSERFILSWLNPSDDLSWSDKQISDRAIVI